MELEDLKPVNKALYMVNKKSLNQVIACQKQGIKHERIAEMLAELPDSFLPDEQDLLLFKSMNTIKEQTN